MSFIFFPDYKNATQVSALCFPAARIPVVLGEEGVCLAPFLSCPLLLGACVVHDPGFLWGKGSSRVASERGTRAPPRDLAVGSSMTASLRSDSSTYADIQYTVISKEANHTTRLTYARNSWESCRLSSLGLRLELQRKVRWRQTLLDSHGRILLRLVSAVSTQKSLNQRLDTHLFRGQNSENTPENTSLGFSG